MSAQDDRMPPDPFDDDEVDDIFALERAEQLAREGESTFDHRWDDLGGEPTIDDFDDAGQELAEEREHLSGAGSSADEDATGPFTAMLPWIGVIAAVVAIAMVLLSGLR
jgi:hypothetical protein